MNVTGKPERDADRFSLTSLLRDHPACGVIVTDGRLKIRSLTPQATRLLGLRSARVSEKDSDCLPTPLRRMVRGVLTSGEPIEGRQLVIPDNDGRETKVRVTVIPLNREDADTGTVVVLTEAAPTGQLERQIRRLDRLASIGTLSVSNAHEIKNALVSVKTFIDLLLEKNQDAELADVVRREMRRISSMVSQTLKFAGPARPTFATVNLHEILDHSLRVVQPQFEKKLISFKRDFKASPSVIRGDDYQLEQAFVNLFLNGIEAMGATGSLTVTTELIADLSPVFPSPAQPGPHVRVTVADTGIGITAENMERLFEPFFTTKEHGTGLGLAITRRIVEEHHGMITAESQPNEGTSFAILLPAHATAD